MDWSWFTTSVFAAAMAALSALCIYAAIIVLTRISGLRSFSKMSSFDFAITVAIGSVIATTVLTRDPPLLQSLSALAAIYALQGIVSVLRWRSAAVHDVVDNVPLLLMSGERLIRENMRAARVTEEDLYSKLREANVLDLAEVRAVVIETTGDISVLHGDPGGAPLSEALLKGVRGDERLMG
jgi:uncharacterized membrane protein YcaP (DUF421 family)